MKIISAKPALMAAASFYFIIFKVKDRAYSRKLGHRFAPKKAKKKDKL
jgi:hypothetical protein